MKKVLQSAEIWVTSALLLVSLVFLVGALGLPGGVFDPLGPGAAPEMIAGALIVLCLAVLVRSILRGQHSHAPQQDDSIDIGKSGDDSTPRSLILFFGLLVAYILAFQFEAGHFIPITIAFVFASTVVFRGFDRLSLLTAAVVSPILSVGLFYVLTRFFVIRLPGAF
ncbi:MAG: tripartite tricarboxylate transporter TctB family protein [Rhodobacteraceae bacterium]|nr:tripartite tricarboxylate transporter TctB family protein [Paracoccaceae bacterium]